MENAWKRTDDRGFLTPNLEEKEKEWNELEPGDLVLLKFTGYHRVPKSISNSWATVIRRNKKGNLVVQSSVESQHPRTINITDISDWKKPTKVL